MRGLYLVAAGTICSAPVALAFDDKPAVSAPQAVRLTWPTVSGPVRPSVADGKAGRSAPDTPRLLKPFGIAVDGAGRVFVADPGHRAVIVYQPDTGATAQWKGNAAHPLPGPVAVATDRDGRVFAVDGYQGRVVIFDASGTPVADFGQGLLKRPEGIAIDSAAGRIYVGDVKLHQVLAFDLRTLKMERSIGDSPEVRFDSPGRVTVNSKGRLLVSDGGNCRVYIFDAGGALVRRFPTQCGERGEVGRPHAIAVDSADRVYVANPDDDSLQVFDSDGKPLRFVPSLGKPAKPPAVRTGIAVDREARVYVVDQQSGAGRLRIFALGRETMRPPVQPANNRRPQ